MNPFFQQLFNAARNTAGRAVRNFDVQALRNMGPSVRRAIGAGSYSIGPITAATKPDPSFLRAAAAAVLAAPGTKASLGLAGAGLTVGTANKIGLTDVVEGGLNQIGPGLDRFFGAITPKPIQDFGKSMEQYGWGALGGFVPGETLSAPTRGLANLPANYRGDELQLAARARADQILRGGSGAGGSVGGGNMGGYVPPATFNQSPADRAHEQEVSRVAQLTAQNPELQRYENARKAAKTQEEMNAVRDMGMQMFQEKYGNTPIGQPGGAIGSFNPLMQKTFGYQTGGSPSEVAQGEAPIAMGDLGTRAGLETGYDPAAYGITPEQIEMMKSKLLSQAKK